MVSPFINPFEETTVVIPAAGGSRDVFGRTSDYPAALIRLGSKPIICLTVEYLIEQGFQKFRIGVQPKYLPNFQNALKLFETSAQIEFHEGVSGESSIGTIDRLITGLPESSPILINLGDTLCKWDTSLLKSSRIAILVERVPETERWSTVSLDEKGYVLEVFEKGKSTSEEIGICGVYWWQSASDLFSVFPKEKLGKNISDVLSPFVGKNMRGIIPEVWCDSDHGDMRENSRHRILESRSFNKIEIDDFRGTIKKTSTNNKKLLMEIEYYKKLPPELKVFFPRMLDYLATPEEAFQVLEYYSYPTLSEIYCYEDVPIFVWNRILAKLSRITFEEFSSHNLQANESHPTLAEVFIEKTEVRNSELLKQDSPLSKVLQAPDLLINGVSYKGVDKVLSQARRIVDLLTNEISIIHGDFCLSNILCEPDSNNIKLIDPRGGFSESSCLGPQLYDVAKLGHSLIGRYDLIIADKFTLNLNGINKSEVNFEILENSLHGQIENEYLNTYLKGHITKEISRMLSGLILLSIPIFHINKQDRAIAMVLQGIKLTNDALQELS